MDRIEFSLDGAKPETHDEIRGIKGSFNQIMKAIPIAKKHCKVNRLNFVLQPDNYHEVVDFCKLCKRLGIPASIIPVSLKLSAQDKLSDDLNDFDVPKLKSLIKEAYAVGNLITNRHFIDIFISKIENGPKSQPCMSPYNCILIFANGDLYPCGNLDDSLGNLNFKTKLDDLYKKSEGLRKKILEGKHERCSRCIYPDIITRGTLRSSLKQRLGTYKK